MSAIVHSGLAVSARSIGIASKMELTKQRIPQKNRYFVETGGRTDFVVPITVEVSNTHSLRKIDKKLPSSTASHGVAQS